MERVRDDEGRVACMHNTPILGLINIRKTDRARSDDTHVADSDMRYAGLG